MAADENDNTNNIITKSENNEVIFYFSESDLIPNNIKEDFSNKQNFLLIFVNPKSGSQQGKIVLEHIQKYRVESIHDYNIISFPVMDEKFIKKQSKEIESNLPYNEIKNDHDPSQTNYSAKFDPLIEFSSIIFNILDKDEIIKGKKFIKKYLEDFPENKIKIIVAGGDGTIIGLVEDLKSQEVPLNRCIFGIIPFGTGNDLSRSLGFGNECEVDEIEDFQRVLYTYLIATQAKIDVWEVTINLDLLTGGIYELVNNIEQLKMDSEHNIIKIFTKTFVNYFSMGFDAIVGYNFEQKRTPYRCCNKLIYGIEGAKRIFCCKKNYGLTDLLDSFQEGSLTKNTNINIKEPIALELSNFEEVRNEPLLPNNDKEDLLKGNSCRRFIFKTKNSGDFSAKSSNIVLKGNPVSIICQNIDFYMGGSQNIWEKSSQIATTQEEISKSQYKQYKRQVFENFQTQKFDDKKLEFFTYDLGIEFGLEKVARGLANRVYQGKGPFFFEFKKNPDEGERAGLEKVFINIDGEFYHICNPSKISIRLNTDICDGQINILRNFRRL